ncbi:MAG: hypothetical protein KDB73_14420 [Planctomycetes bacterium]|nr:hypothetical protein [Planctomycetota bacterium]
MIALLVSMLCQGQEALASSDGEAFERALRAIDLASTNFEVAGEIWSLPDDDKPYVFRRSTFSRGSNLWCMHSWIGRPGKPPHERYVYSYGESAYELSRTTGGAWLGALLPTESWDLTYAPVAYCRSIMGYPVHASWARGTSRELTARRDGWDARFRVVLWGVQRTVDLSVRADDHPYLERVVVTDPTLRSEWQTIEASQSAGPIRVRHTVTTEGHPPVVSEFRRTSLTPDPMMWRVPVRDLAGKYSVTALGLSRALGYDSLTAVSGASLVRCAHDLGTTPVEAMFIRPPGDDDLCYYGCAQVAAWLYLNAQGRPTALETMLAQCSVDPQGLSELQEASRVLGAHGHHVAPRLADWNELLSLESAAVAVIDTNSGVAHAMLVRPTPAGLEVIDPEKGTYVLDDTVPPPPRTDWTCTLLVNGDPQPRAWVAWALVVAGIVFVLVGTGSAVGKFRASRATILLVVIASHALGCAGDEPSDSSEFVVVDRGLDKGRLRYDVQGSADVLRDWRVEDIVPSCGCVHVLPGHAADSPGWRGVAQLSISSGSPDQSVAVCLRKRDGGQERREHVLIRCARESPDPGVIWSHGNLVHMQGGKGRLRILVKGRRESSPVLRARVVGDDEPLSVRTTVPRAAGRRATLWQCDLLVSQSATGTALAGRTIELTVVGDSAGLESDAKKLFYLADG